MPLLEVRDIIKDFGGNIRAGKNEPGGACFVITLPVVDK